MKIKVIGAGLAGCAAAYRLAESGVEPVLCAIKPEKFTPAHSDGNFCELVCSNSLKSRDAYSNACGLLKEEMRVLGSLTMEAAEHAEVPAGNALAVDRKKFAEFVTKKIRSHKNISVVCEEVTAIPRGGVCVIATGPLTSGALSEDIAAAAGRPLHFYDASAPVISRRSIDFDRCFAGDRYGKGGDDYLNCPMNESEYGQFVTRLVSAERADKHEFEKGEIFEGCMPIEVMAARGADTLRFGPLKPVGLRDADGNAFYAVLQLRKETAEGDMYNLVGCQTNLKFGEQRSVFSLIPALKNAEFLRYGVMHRNTFLQSPECLNADMSLKSDADVFFAGQITGVEGYVESAASGILAAVNAGRRAAGKPPSVPGNDTVIGALAAYVCAPDGEVQPMRANFGILRAPERNIRDKKARYRYLAERALESVRIYAQDL